MSRCEDEQMWRWADVKMRRCEDKQMWRWADVKMSRCEDEQMWRWEGVKMSRCEDEMWRWEDVKMRRCFTDPHYWKNPALRRSREKFSQRSLRDLVVILVRSSLRGPCIKILVMPRIKGARMKALLWEILVSRSCKILSSSKSFDFLLRILWDSLRGPGVKIMVKVFYNFLWEDLVEILAKPCEIL